MDLREVKGRQGKELKRHPWELARAEVIHHQLKNQLKASNFNSILDLGCGDTFLVEFLAQKFSHIQFYAIDIAFTDEQLQYLKSTVPPNVSVYKTLDELKVENLVFDAVLLLDVIEHIEDEISFLKEVKSKSFISENTKFLITVPAYQSLFCSHDTFLGHYRRYTNKLLKGRLNQAGFVVDSKSYFFTMLLLPRILQVIKEKITPPSMETTGLVEWEAGKLKTDTIKNILYTDYRLNQILNKLSIKLPGLSNLAVCHPSV